MSDNLGVKVTEPTFRSTAIDTCKREDASVHGAWWKQRARPRKTKSSAVLTSDLLTPKYSLEEDEACEDGVQRGGIISHLNPTLPPSWEQLHFHWLGSGKSTICN